jgi:hypothetical protein
MPGSGGAASAGGSTTGSGVGSTGVVVSTTGSGTGGGAGGVGVLAFFALGGFGTSGSAGIWARNFFAARDRFIVTGTSFGRGD